jgi:hypothetical protein
MMRFVLALTVMLVACAACQSTPSQKPPPPELCAARPRCKVVQRRPVAGGAGLTLFDLRLEHAPGAQEEERCDRREYWVVGPRGNRLLAADCAVQWGPDAPGPATTRLEGTKLYLRSDELKANDVCELSAAVVDLATLRVTQGRRRGTFVRRECVGQSDAELFALGDGSAAKPLVTLHQ